jgi:hypothetical protein
LYGDKKNPNSSRRKKIPSMSFDSSSDSSQPDNRPVAESGAAKPGVSLVGYRQGHIILQVPAKYADRRAIVKLLLRSNRLLESALKIQLDAQGRFSVPVPVDLRALHVIVILRYAGQTVELTGLHAPPLHTIEWLVESSDGSVQSAQGPEAALTLGIGGNTASSESLRVTLNGVSSEHTLSWTAIGADLTSAAVGGVPGARVATLENLQTTVTLTVKDKVGSRIVGEYQLQVKCD